MVRYGFSLLPRDFVLTHTAPSFQAGNVSLRSYLVTIGITALGTGLSLMLTSMGGYVLQRQDFPLTGTSFPFCIFHHAVFRRADPNLYSHGDLSQYEKHLSCADPSSLLTPWYLMLMRNFIKSIPFSIVEAAKIDGAGDWKIFGK